MVSAVVWIGFSVVILDNETGLMKSRLRIKRLPITRPPRRKGAVGP
jgi:hypothetical protein